MTVQSVVHCARQPSQLSQITILLISCTHMPESDIFFLTIRHMCSQTIQGCGAVRVDRLKVVQPTKPHILALVFELWYVSELVRGSRVGRDEGLAVVKEHVAESSFGRAMRQQARYLFATFAIFRCNHASQMYFFAEVGESGS